MSRVLPATVRDFASVSRQSEVDGEPPSRNLSVTVSAQNEVIKDLIGRVSTLESLVVEIEATATPRSS